jgi:hypothetical protein
MCGGELKLSWSLRGVGSAEFTWWPAGEEPVRIFTTYLGDALSDLVEAGIALGLGTRTAFVTLLGEPVGYRIFFSGDEKTIRAEIVRFDDPTSGEDAWNHGKVRWTGSVSRTVLITAIRDMVSEVLRQHDPDEYEREWGYPFPVDRYEMLEVEGMS